MESSTCVIRRPQALGAFPLPAGYLLIEGDSPEIDRARRDLVAGRTPQQWPTELHGHERAHAGDLDGAIAAFDGPSPIAAYNRFVLAPEGVDIAALREALPDDLAPLVDIVAYAVGLTQRPPSIDSTTDEIRALVLASHASAYLDRGDAPSAAGTLYDAVQAAESVSAPLAAVLLGHAATLVHEHQLVGPDGSSPTEALTRAITLLDDTDLTVGQAELQLQLGLLIHDSANGDPKALSAAVEHYHAALRSTRRETSPELWASANLNLGTAYLTMPMTEASDQLRTGIAMQCLRAALEVFTADQHPGQWASAQLNLANALVYSPSTHQADNVVEAVELYEEVLAVRDRESDPLGRARVLANQGNALAHLGIFDHAKAKLYEARYLFEEYLDHDSAMAVRSVLDEIAKQTVPDGAPRAGGFPNASDVSAIKSQRAFDIPVAPKMRVTRLDQDAAPTDSASTDSAPADSASAESAAAEKGADA